MKGKICTCSIENGAADRHCQLWTLSACGTTDGQINHPQKNAREILTLDCMSAEMAYVCVINVVCVRPAAVQQSDEQL